MKILEEFGFPYFQEKKPFLGLCLGAQLLGL
jgi:imidazoleglycerol phosphate synthase glutamine amidotransferase subunit HisH